MPKKSTPVSNASADKSMAANEAMFQALLTEIQGRANLASRMGVSYGGDRNLYDALGYKKTPDINDFLAMYKRNQAARAVIDRPVMASWREAPEIRDQKPTQGSTPTPFETEWATMVKEFALFKVFRRVDRMSALGKFAILLLGYSGNESLEVAPKGKKRLIYVQPYSEQNSQVDKLVTNSRDPRYGLPEFYSITMQTAGTGTGRSRQVHWSRVIHVAEDLFESNINGIPMLESVYNRLQDLDKIVGCSAEMFWMNANQGLAFMMEKGATLKGQAATDFDTMVEDFTHKFRRILRVKGMDVKSLDSEVADPKGNVDVNVDMICAARGIPKRIFTGSERGELASSQDERNWADTIMARQTDHCEPTIIRQFIDRNVEHGALAAPSTASEDTDLDYEVVWPDLKAPTLKERVEIGKKIMEAIKVYVDALGAQDIIPAETVLRKLGFSDQELIDIQAAVKAQNRDLGTEPDSGDGQQAA